MGTRLYTLTLLAVLVLAGCSGIRVSQDYTAAADLRSLDTYAWHQEVQEKTGDIRIDTPLIDRRIRAVIDETLRARGFRNVVRDRADFHVAYQYSIRSRLEADQPRTSFGFGFGTYGSHSAFGISTGTDVSSYDEGLLVIDFLDARDGSTLWRGKGTRRVFVHTKPEELTRQINATVHKILDQFPP